MMHKDYQQTQGQSQNIYVNQTIMYPVHQPGQQQHHMTLPPYNQFHGLPTYPGGTEMMQGSFYAVSQQQNYGYQMQVPVTMPSYPYAPNYYHPRQHIYVVDQTQHGYMHHPNVPTGAQHRGPPIQQQPPKHQLTPTQPQKEKNKGVKITDPNTGNEVKLPNNPKKTQREPHIENEAAKLVNEQFKKQVEAKLTDNASNKSKHTIQKTTPKLSAPPEKKPPEKTPTLTNGESEKKSSIDIQKKDIDKQTQNDKKIVDNVVQEGESVVNNEDTKIKIDKKDSLSEVKPVENKPQVVEEIVEQQSEVVTESAQKTDIVITNENKTERKISKTERKESKSEPEVTQETNPASTMVHKKKKNSKRYKEYEDKTNDDMFSAYTDAPEKKEEQKITEVVQKVVEEVSLDDLAWEDKEKSIEKEIIRNEDSEEPEIIPKKVETKVIQSQDMDTSEEDKLRYDRDFLLRFQFAPICKSKPAGLPDIEIVLDTAHAPTSALNMNKMFVPSNDFLPSFARSQSGGGRSSRDKGPKGMRGPAPAIIKPQKIIVVQPQFEKIELKKSDNAWIRPSEKSKDLSEEEKEVDELKRRVTSILNKLTPQKFDALVSQMQELKVDSKEKLQETVNLIFEKALSEPNFAVAYANMCKVLSVNKFREADESIQSMFRKLLLNKCQKEFERDKTEEEELANENKNKKFANEEEKKLWEEEMFFKEQKTRRRMLGNIRFIGELYKYDMITEKIMHECVFKLLMQETIEDSLECLCKLLTTIGKKLDHPKAKVRIDQYFTQIQKIVDKKKVSSRIRFALKDLLDLRRSSWVPRRDDSNPKTIDQIHKEALQKEREEEFSRQQEKLKKPEQRVKVGGRDSPSMRGGGSDWNMSNKSRGAPTTTIDTSKFKQMAKKNESEITLGPGGKPFTSWSRGASGGSGTSRSGSGSNTPTSEVDQRSNRFDVLGDTMMSEADIKRAGRAGSSSRKTHPIGMSRLEERKAAIKAVEAQTSGGRGSRNQSPARTDSPVRPSSEPTSGVQTPLSGARSPVCGVTEEKMSKVTKSTIEEFFSVNDLKEATLCIKELESPHLHPIFVQEAISVVIEKGSTDRRKLGGLFIYMMKDGLLTLEQMRKGLEALVEVVPDIAVDVPMVYKNFGEVIGASVYDGTLPLNKVKDTLEPLIPAGKAGLIMAEALSVAVQISGNEESVSQLWADSKLLWNMLLNEKQNVDEFVKDKKLEFTLVAPSRKGNHASDIQIELMRLLNETRDNNSRIISYIQEKVEENIQCSPDFIQSLTKTVCESTIRQETSTYKCDTNLLKSRRDILERFINSNKQLELNALFSLQQLATELNHPRELLRDIFSQLYEDGVISEETFFIWETSKDFPDGKGVALSSVKEFLVWLQKSEEQSNEDDCA